MHSLFRALTIAGLLGIGFISGALTAVMRSWFQLVAHVTIQNESGQDITDIKFTDISAGRKSAMLLSVLPHGQRTTVHFFVAGEGGYGLEATLSDGRVLTANGGYIESRYRVTDVVRASSIDSKTVLYGT